uniref:Uncharacterized protein n=1 Tax=Takifugu rubripes TaxID=31033 RepID=A0A674P9R4_TAKRU
LTGSPSSSAGLCTPARSPGKAGRSRGPGAPSYSSRCFQTGGQKHTDGGTSSPPQSINRRKFIRGRTAGKRSTPKTRRCP